MLTLFSKDYSKLTTFIFKLYDFDNTGIISKEDVRTIMSHVTLVHNDSSQQKSFKFEKETFEDRIESQEELHNLIDKCFKNEESIDYTNFLKIIEEIDSNIFLTLFTFILENKPFSLKTFENYKFLYKLKENDEKGIKQENIEIENKIIFHSPILINIKNKTSLSKNNGELRGSLNNKGSKSPTTPSSKLLASPSILAKLMASQTISKSPSLKSRKIDENTDVKSKLGKFLNIPDPNAKQKNTLLKFCGSNINVLFF